MSKVPASNIWIISAWICIGARCKRPGGHPNSSTGGHPKFLHLIEHSGA